MHPAPERDVSDDRSLTTDHDDVVVEDAAETPKGVEGADDDHHYACEGRPPRVAAPV